MNHTQPTDAKNFPIEKIKALLNEMTSCSSSEELKKFWASSENQADLEKYKNNLLQLAAYERKFMIVKFLIEEKGVDINTQEPFPRHDPGSRIAVSLDKSTPLICASNYQSLLSEEEEALKEKESLKESESLGMIRYLIEKGADINAKNAEGMTAAHAAALGQNKSILKYLIRQNANLSIKTNRDLDHAHNLTPFGLAIKMGSENIAELLANHGGDQDYNSFYELGHRFLGDKNATEEEKSFNKQFLNPKTSLEAIQKFLRVKKNQSLLETQKDYLLMRLAGQGNLEKVKFLCEKCGKKPNLNAKIGPFEKTAILCAATQNHTSVVTYLVKQGAHIEVEDSCGRTLYTFIDCQYSRNSRNEELKQIVSKVHAWNSSTRKSFFKTLSGFFGSIFKTLSTFFSSIAIFFKILWENMPSLLSSETFFQKNIAPKPLQKSIGNTNKGLERSAAQNSLGSTAPRMKH